VDRRTAFFVLAAAVCALLLPEARDFAWMAGVLTIIYGLLATASWLDERSRRRS
jgi:hypothetical protein